MKKKIFAFISSIIFMLVGMPVYAQPVSADISTFPTKPIRLIVGYPPGGNVDIAARIISDELSKKLGQTVLVENKAGASGQIAAVATTQAVPDGYTIFLGASPELAILHALKRKLPYDSKRDFQPISLATVVPFVLVVNPSVKATTVKELVELAKANPGMLNYASFGNGSSNHLFGELFKHKTGINMTHVPYQGGGPAVAALVAGQVQVEFDSLGVMLPHIKAGKLRALAIGMSERSPLAPDIPTMSEAGLSGLEGGTWNGFVGPAGISPAITAKLSQKITEAMNVPSVKQKLIEKGVIPSAGSPEEFGKFIAGEIERWGQVAESANIRLE